MAPCRILPARVAALALAATLMLSFVPIAASAASLKLLVVQASEVASAYGSGFKVLNSRPMRPSDLKGVTIGSSGPTTPLMKAFVGGYSSSFYRSPVSLTGPVTKPKPAVSLVTSGVSLFSNAAYPLAALEYTMKNRSSVLTSLRKQHVTHVQLGWFNGVGEKAIMLAYAITIPALTPGSKPFSTQAITLIFSRGKFASTLSVSGTGSISKDATLAIAQRVDSRLQHAR